jgi:hypothetical protein
MPHNGFEFVFEVIKVDGESLLMAGPPNGAGRFQALACDIRHLWVPVPTAKGVDLHTGGMVKSDLFKHFGIQPVDQDIRVD